MGERIASTRIGSCWSCPFFQVTGEEQTTCAKLEKTINGYFYRESDHVEEKVNKMFTEECPLPEAENG